MPSVNSILKTQNNSGIVKLTETGLELFSNIAVKNNLTESEIEKNVVIIANDIDEGGMQALMTYRKETKDNNNSNFSSIQKCLRSILLSGTSRSALEKLTKTTFNRYYSDSARVSKETMTLNSKKRPVTLIDRNKAIFSILLGDSIPLK